jgi:hypothetical protein
MINIIEDRKWQSIKTRFKGFELKIQLGMWKIHEREILALKTRRLFRGIQPKGRNKNILIRLGYIFTGLRLRSGSYLYHLFSGCGGGGKEEKKVRERKRKKEVKVQNIMQGK